MPDGEGCDLLVVALLEQVGVWRIGNVERHLGSVTARAWYREKGEDVKAKLRAWEKLVGDMIDTASSVEETTENLQACVPYLAEPHQHPTTTTTTTTGA